MQVNADVEAAAIAQLDALAARVRESREIEAQAWLRVRDALADYVRSYVLVEDGTSTEFFKEEIESLVDDVVDYLTTYATLKEEE